MSNRSDLHLTLPVADKYPMVLVTGDALRHIRFAMRVQSEFPGHVVAWLQLPTQDQRTSAKQKSLGEFTKTARSLRSQLETGESNRSMLKSLLDSLRAGLRSKASLEAAEQSLFGKEVEKLGASCTVRPTRVENFESESTFSLLKSLKPFFILVYGHPAYVPALRACAEGHVVSQSDAWAPECDASFQVYWALYHRDLSKIVSTIRFWKDGVAEAIAVSSSAPCLAVDDTPASCFARQAAVGTELMCELLGNLIKTKAVRLDQHYPETSLPMDTEPAEDIRREVESDLRRGLIKRETARKMAF